MTKEIKMKSKMLMGALAASLLSFGAVAQAQTAPFEDLDRDGVQNRWDSDRDGDGLTNRSDPQPNLWNPVRTKRTIRDLDRDGIADRDDRDRDGDGIVNARDPNPDVPNRVARAERLNRGAGPNGDLDRDGIANRNDRDRDGDGVANARDRFPDNYRRG